MSDQLPSSAVADRVLRRAERSVGVIDVRDAQQRVERATEWPRRHLSMVERWAGRGAGVEAGTDSNADQVLAAHRRAALSAVAEGSPSVDSIPTKAAVAASAVSFTSTTAGEPRSRDAHSIGLGENTPLHNVHIGPAMRAVSKTRGSVSVIARQPAASSEPSVAPESRTTATPAQTSAGHVVVESHLVAPSRGESALPLARTTSGERASTEQASQSVVATRASSATAAPLTEAESHAVKGGSVLTEHSPTARVSVASSTAPLAGAAKPLSSSAPARVAAQPVVAPAPPRAELTLMRSRMPIGTATNAAAAHTIARSVDRETSRVSVDPSAFAEPVISPAPAVQNSVDRSLASVVADSAAAHRSNGTQAVRSEMTLRTPRATEIVQRVPAAASASEIVWRKTAPAAHGIESHSASALVASATAPQAAIARRSEPGATSSPSATFPEPNMSRARTPDTAQLVEQVTRRLYRQMAVERERRGGNR